MFSIQWSIHSHIPVNEENGSSGTSAGYSELNITEVEFSADQLFLGMAIEIVCPKVTGLMLYYLSNVEMLQLNENQKSTQNLEVETI